MYSNAELFQIGFFAILIFQVFMIAFQTSMNRRKESLLYLIYIFSVFVYNFRFILDNITGYKIPDLTLYLDRPLVSIIFFAYFRFGRYFVDVPSIAPKFNRIGIYYERFLIGFVLLYCVLIYSNLNENNLGLIFNVYSVLSTLFSSIYLIYYVKSVKSKLNSFVFAGAALILMGASATFFMYEWQKAYHSFSLEFLSFPHQVATTLELMVFTSGISLKSYILEKEQRKAEQFLVKTLQQKEQLIDEINAIKTSISADLHDDIGATLNSIEIYCAVAQKELSNNNPPLANQYLERIQGLVNESLIEMRDMIWLLKSEKFQVGDLVERWQQYAQPLMNAKSIELSIATDNLALSKSISINEKRQLYFVMKEILNNVFKHSKSQKLEVKIELVNGKLSLSFKDFGKGFDHQKVVEGEGIYNMKRRIESINGTFNLKSNLNEGTLINIVL